MSKTKSSGKVHWATVDKRVRDRREAWNAGELEELDKQLARLPDVAEQAEIIDVVQPAINPRDGQSEESESTVGDGGGAADARGDAAAGETN